MKKWINEENTTLLVEILSVGLIIFIGYILFLNNSYGLNSFDSGDVHRGFQRGVNVLNGVNSYLEFNPERMLHQEKVPGFFPLYFQLMAVIARISNYSFVLFLDSLRYLVFAAYSLVGIVIYLLLRKQSKLLGILGMVIFMFNRWTLNNAFDLKQDTYVLAVLFISLLLLKKNKALSFLLFGVATAIKHLTIFLFPIYLLELFLPIMENRSDWRNKKFLGYLGRFFVYAFLLILPILGPSIPYIIETPQHYTSSIMYNLTRDPESNTTTLSTGFDKVLVLYNQDRFQNNFFYMLPRLPMFVSFCIIALLYFTKKLTLWKYSAFAYLIFIGFNPVLFGQYYTWLMAFLPLVLVEDRS